MMPIMHALYPIIGKVQHYSWGGFDFIPGLLGLEKQAAKPYAEYWLGTHPAQPATLQAENTMISLPDFINTDPQRILGEKVANRFGGLPFLLKVLDVRQMLSIQVHPDRQSAAAAFEAENEAGIPLDALNRNYRDRNHKPELMVALGNFWLLHGFKPIDRLQEILSAEPDLAFLLPVLEQGGYKGLYELLMNMPQSEVNGILQPMIDRIIPLYHNQELQKEEEDFWVARAAETFCRNGFVDRGIFSIYLFNLLHLKKGEGIYQPAGLPHAYLEGQNVEIMANSDNVLRAGLTDKHIDIAELMRHVRFEPTNPLVLQKAAGETLYQSPAAEFALTALEGTAGREFNFHTSGPEILLVLDGEVQAVAGADVQPIKKGSAVFLVHDTSVQLRCNSRATIFRAFVPG